MNNILKQAEQYFQAAQFEQAESLCKSVLGKSPRHVHALNLLGMIYTQENRPQQANKCFRTAIKASPQDVTAYFNLAGLHMLSADYQAAIPMLRKTLAINPEHIGALNSLAHALEMTGQYAHAKKYYNAAITAQPGHADAYANLGDLAKKLGNISEAINYYQLALKNNPQLHKTYYTLAFCQRFTSHDSTLQAMIDYRQQSGLTNEQKINLDYALAKAYEDLQDYDKSFAHLYSGNNLKRGLFAYSIETELELFDKLIELFRPNLFEQFKAQGHPATTPIFIVGMPRSGTSLTEQILSSHPEVYGAGESPAMFTTISQHHLQRVDKLDSLADSLSAKKIYAIGKDYIKSITKLAPTSRYIINKLPHNFLMIGFIKLALPNARIIHCLRNPMDTCYSMYQHNFESRHLYAHDLVELGKYYNAYAKLMRHWNGVIADEMLEFHYEDLVTNQQEQTKKLLEFCNLDWHAGCLEFYNNERAVVTASAAQVREPINQTAVMRWKKYQRQLQPLFATLEPHLQQQSL